MTGLAYSLELDALASIADRLEGLGDRRADLLFDIGTLLENSVKERIATGKQSPDGEPWTLWSQDYRATRGNQHSLLVSNNDLLQSIQNYATEDEIHVGSNLIYAAIHHFGGEEVGSNIPARPYLGVSAEDADEIRALMIGDVKEAFQ